MLSNNLIQLLDMYILLPTSTLSFFSRTICTYVFIQLQYHVIVLNVSTTPLIATWLLL